MQRRAASDTRSRVAAFALAAMILYPVAMVLPILRLEKLGHTHSATIWSGTVDLLADGQIAIGALIFVCSIVVPILKLGGMLVLCVGGGWLRPRHKVLTFRTIDLIGRWGMIDVLLVAVLVAAVKLGDWAEVQAGPGALAFAGVVALSMAASAVFDPVYIWEEQT